MTQYENIRVEHKDFISWIVLDRPRAANALSHNLFTELSDALKGLESEGAPIVGIRGAGKGFSSGFDLKDVAYASSPDTHALKDRDRLQGYVDHFLEVWDHPKPVIAAVHGYCIGGATQLCSYADFTIVADDADIGESSVPIGGGFVAPLWVPLVGARRAKELSLIPANRIDGRTAVEWGWANYAVPVEDVVATAESYAERMSRMPADALRIKKLSVNRAAEAAGARAAALSVADLNALVHASPGVAALRAWLAEVGVQVASEAYRTGVGLPDHLR